MLIHPCWSTPGPYKDGWVPQMGRERLGYQQSPTIIGRDLIKGAYLPKFHSKHIVSVGFLTNLWRRNFVQIVQMALGLKMYLLF